MAEWEHQEEFSKLYNRRNLLLLYKIAETNGSIMTLKYTERDNKKEEKYVLIASNKDWIAKIKDDSGVNEDSINLTRLVELLILSKNTGFHHYQIPFIIKDNIPDKDFIEPVAIHEIIEIELDGVAERCARDVSYHFEDKEEREQYLKEEMEAARRYPHQEACIAELQLVFNKGEEFSHAYSSWLMKTNCDLDDLDTFFNQAEPNFLKENNRTSKDTLAVVVEFYLKITMHGYKTETGRKNLLEDWPWIEKFLPAIKS